MLEANIPREWLRGVLDPCLLALLDRGETYGYELAGRLQAAGLGPVPGGTLYPALLRLEKQAMVSSQWKAGDGGPGRKYYCLTETGRAALRAQRASWRTFTAAVDGILDVAAER